MKIISPEVLPKDMLKAFKRTRAELSDAHFSKSLGIPLNFNNSEEIDA